MTRPGRYVKRPITVEALQLFTSNAEEVLAWILDSGGQASYSYMLFTIHTLEGRMTANFGDWIIRGVQGEFYACKPDIFEATYEPA